MNTVLIFSVFMLLFNAENLLSVTGQPDRQEKYEICFEKYNVHRDDLLNFAENENNSTIRCAWECALKLMNVIDDENNFSHEDIKKFFLERSAHMEEKDIEELDKYCRKCVTSAGKYKDSSEECMAAYQMGKCLFPAQSQ